jgi:hypothetical protein
MATPRLCSIPNCYNPHYARGWCCAHYQRWRHYGDPLTPNKDKRGEARRFYTEVVLTHDGDDCLIWPYWKGGRGYARMDDKGKMRPVSRMVCEHVNGPPPSSKHETAHSCGHKGCVNWRHLRWATSRENAADKISHGTWGKTITEETAREMLSLKGLRSVNEISERFGVHPSFVYKLFKGTTWRHLQTD